MYEYWLLKLYILHTVIIVIVSAIHCRISWVHS